MKEGGFTLNQVTNNKKIIDSRELAVEAEGLVKVFGDNRAVDGVDLQVRTGSIYGVLGPNGAGKQLRLECSQLC